MKSPIDVFALISDAIDIERSRSVPVSVNILIDETADAKLQAFVRTGFIGDAPNSRVTMSYFPTQEPDSSLACDAVVIVAGQSDRVGAIAHEAREAGRAVLVVASSGDAVRERAEAAGFPIPQEDVAALEPGCDEQGAQDALADAIGAWIVASCPEKRLPFAVAYPFVRRPLAQESVRATSLQNAGVGVVVFVPGADMPIMTANQAKMVLQIAAAYGEPLGPERVKELAGVLAGAFFFRGVARQLSGVVPALGWAVKGTLGYVGTQAIGRAAIEYFEKGGDVAGLTAVVGKAADAAVRTASTVQSKPTAQVVGSAALRVATGVLDAAAPVAQSAGKTVFSALRPGKGRGSKRR